VERNPSGKKMTSSDIISETLPASMTNSLTVPGDFYKMAFQFQQIMMIYESAIKQIETKLDILNKESSVNRTRNPISTVKSRIKSPESIAKKLEKKGLAITFESMMKNLNDIAGVRIVCSFTSDIYRLAEMIGQQNDITVLSVKDYIKNPKRSGYKSYHMIVTIPIFLSDRAVETKVEIQIRTIAMDFWASLEHKIYYKFEGNAPEYISKDLRECSAIVSMLDAKMLSLNEAILQAKKEQDGREPELELKERRPEAIGPSDNIIRALSTVAAKGETLKA
jgi:putative GTP pyrophosphokinase